MAIAAPLAILGLASIFNKDKQKITVETIVDNSITTVTNIMASAENQNIVVTDQRVSLVVEGVVLKGGINVQNIANQMVTVNTSAAVSITAEQINASKSFRFYNEKTRNVDEK